MCVQLDVVPTSTTSSQEQLHRSDNAMVMLRITPTTTVMVCGAGEEAALGAQPGFDVEAMEERAGVAAAQDYNGFSWQQMMETGQQWRDFGYPEDQVSFPKCKNTCDA